MKPLNHKERNDTFFNFVVAGTITLGLTIFCFYFTNDFLTDAIAEERVKQYSNFQQYKRNHQQYIKQLQQINKALSGDFAGSSMTNQSISDFKTSFKNNRDTSVLMSRIVDLSNKNALLIDQRNQSRLVLNGLKSDLRKCREELNKID